MAELKTRQTSASVEKFLDQVEDELKRKDCYTIAEMMQKITKLEPKMWGTAMVGFGSYHYKYATGHEGNTCLIGFSPRKQNISLYLCGGLDQQKKLLTKLGKHKTGVGCLYIKKLSDIDTKILEQIIRKSIDAIKARVPNKKA